MKHKKMNRKADGSEEFDDSDNENTSTNENSGLSSTASLSANQSDCRLQLDYSAHDVDNEEIDVVSDSDWASVIGRIVSRDMNETPRLIT